MLTALTRKFSLAASVDLEEVAAACVGSFTGADLYALCSDAWLHAAKRTVRGVTHSPDLGDSFLIPDGGDGIGSGGGGEGGGGRERER